MDEHDEMIGLAENLRQLIEGSAALRADRRRETMRPMRLTRLMARKVG